MAEAAGALLSAWRVVGRLATPLLPLFLARRARQGKEDPARLGEKLGNASRKRPRGPLIWVHAASVGETNAVLPLIERIATTGVTVLLTTVTVTSAAVAARHLPKSALHQFAPLDAAGPVHRFLAHWRPELALFVESEIWPTTILELADMGVPFLLVNARLSERSARNWQGFPRSRAALFGQIALGLAQSETDGRRLQDAGLKNTIVTGNLKFDAPPPATAGTALAVFKRAMAGRRAWVAASTHEGEETLVAAAQRAIAAVHKGALAIVVPRHPSRGPAIRAALAAAGFTVALRSAGEPVRSETEIYIADTLGELGLFYRAAPIAFVGGSLVPHGGQNPIEPVRLGAAVLHGPHVFNFKEVYAVLDAAQGALPVENAEALAAAVGRLYAEPAAAERIAVAATAALAPHGGALDRTMAALKPYLDPLAAWLEAPAASRVLP